MELGRDENGIMVHDNWENITDEKMRELESKIRQLIIDEVGIDADGDVGIEFLLINRNKEDWPGYLPIESLPYPATLKQELEYLNLLDFNASIANERLSSFIRRIRHYPMKDTRKEE